MSFEEHLIENAICFLQREKDYETALRKFKQSPVNMDMAAELCINMDYIMAMAAYVEYTYRPFYERGEFGNQGLAVCRIGELENEPLFKVDYDELDWLVEAIAGHIKEDPKWDIGQVLLRKFQSIC